MAEIERVMWIALGALIAAIVGYFGGYFSKKGENVATHEDIDKLREQTAALTLTTKEIEAKISGELWDRQKQWELTRDAAIRLMEAQARLEDAGDRVTRVERQRQVMFSMEPREEIGPALEEWRAAKNAMIDAIGFISFVSWTKQTSDAIGEYILVIHSFRNADAKDLPYQIISSASGIGFAFNALRNALRNELRLQEKEVSYPGRAPRSTG